MKTTSTTGGERAVLELPAAPADLTGAVKAWRQPVVMRTYEPDAPDTNPMFLEKRVYQGSSGRVYPLPYYDRISTDPNDRTWDAIHLENEYIRLMVLPELGGRIHIGYDKLTGYDFFYRQNVIKPALVGLAGPWVSGGVEFNWPQHHRPGTYMPVQTEIEHHADGSVTVWCSDHDPMLRMKGMHGLRLHPDRAALELKVRLYNRTPLTQTFLWWANVATRVHDRYQSFFPTDVRFVADHAKRAITSYPHSNAPYYGVDYPGRARNGVPEDEMPAHFVPDGSYAADDLSWYANIPVPTSYMITGSAQDFHGGYDHARGAGVVHVANRHISPGKKQWTWGNHEFGYAWDRSLTDSDGPYIELMAGVYTDNQPDFSYLAPWETKTFTQSWFPIHGIGVPQAANTEAALRLATCGSEIQVGLQVTRDQEELRVVVRAGGAEIYDRLHRVTVAEPLLLTLPLPGGAEPQTLAARVYRGERLLIAHEPSEIVPAEAPTVAQEPASPADVATVEELFLTGLHLAQYRHATRSPLLYWEEALRRDAGNSRVHNALGLWHLRRGELGAACDHFRQAIARLTRLNPNPYDGEAFYNLGLAERLSGSRQKAYDAFYKATWNAAWRAPAYFALAEMDAAAGEAEQALDHVDRCLRAEADHLNARALRVHLLRVLGRTAAADEELAATRRLDPLDIGSRWLSGLPPRNGQEALDLALDLLRSAQDDEALRVLRAGLAAAGPLEGAEPILLFTVADVLAEAGRATEAEAAWQQAEAASLAYCFPSRLEEMQVLERTLQRHPESASAAYLLGTLFYDRRRHREAIALWQLAARLRPGYATVFRNLGIAAFNIEQDAAAARIAFDKAASLDPADGRIAYERDQLWKRIGEAPEVRLAELERQQSLVVRRDDLTLEKATLLNQLGRHDDALALLLGRRFQPWEGGEGLVLGQYLRAHAALARAALQAGDAAAALAHLDASRNIPESLSEAKHLLANGSELDLLLGDVYAALGNGELAERAWRRAAEFKGDFQQMAVRTISDKTYWTALAQERLGGHAAARATFELILQHAQELERTPPRIDYFATSLPSMLLFDEDLDRRNQIDSTFLRAQAFAGLKQTDEAKNLLRQVLAMDRNHDAAADLLAEFDTEIVRAR